MDSVKKIIRKLVPQKFLRGVEQAFRMLRGLFWQVRYGFPARGMHVIAVTGTNGKTTTSSYINEVLKAAGFKTAVFTTALIEIAGEVEPNRTHFTLVKQSLVQQFFARARKADVDWVVLEVTSHAIDQHRIIGVPVEIAVMTNLTQDHLDYHGTMEEYARVKSLLFGGYFDPKFAVLNADDEWYPFFHDRTTGTVMSYGKEGNAAVHLKKQNSDAKGSKATFEYKGREHSFYTHLQGAFNVYNALAAASVGMALYIDPKVIVKGIESLQAVPGRMEAISEGQKFNVLVDFAYTPDALEKALQALQETTKGKVRIVFGATGDRDKGKRPLMGKAAAAYADAIYLTDDETYTEDPDTIREAVFAGIKEAGAEKKTKVIADREEAIETAFKDAKAGDSVLLAGIGHEDSRNMGGKQIPWSDQAVARELLKK